MVEEFTQEQKIKIEQMHNAGVHTSLIRKEIGCSNRKLKKYLRDNGFVKSQVGIQWDTESFREHMAILNPNIEVLGDYINARTKIHVRCKIDGYEWYPTPDNLLEGAASCPVCLNKVIIPGINDIWTTNPEMGKYLDDPEDGYKYSAGSNKNLNMHCPNCGYKKKMSPNTLYRAGFGCKYCSDGVSYPQKVMRNILNQLEIEYEPEYSPEWIKPRRYDFYLINDNVIIETNGIQHYKDSFSDKMRTVEYQQNNDREKKDLALKNGVSNVIFVDCSISDIEYIKKSLYGNKEILKIFDLDSVNWVDVEVQSRKSLLVEVCNYYNSLAYDEIKTFASIAKQFNISETTVGMYLNSGSNIGICNYVQDKMDDNILNMRARIVYEVDSDYNIIKEWHSIASAVKYYNTHAVENRLRGNTSYGHEYNGHYWYYKEDYEKLMEDQKLES